MQVKTASASEVLAKGAPAGEVLTPVAAAGAAAAKIPAISEMEAVVRRASERERQKDFLARALELVNLLPSERDEEQDKSLEERLRRRELKYEVKDEADMVQVQVLNASDGEVVRKIPADEIIELVTRIHKFLNDRLAKPAENVDVMA